MRDAVTATEDEHGTNMITRVDATQEEKDLLTTELRSKGDESGRLALEAAELKRDLCKAQAEIERLSAAGRGWEQAAGAVQAANAEADEMSRRLVRVEADYAQVLSDLQSSWDDVTMRRP